MSTSSPRPVAVARRPDGARARCSANLIENAQLHGRRRRITVTVERRENGTAESRVEDEGPGFGPRRRSSHSTASGAAAPPRRARASASRSCRATAERHGGRARVDGARFTIELPALRDHLRAPALQLEARPPRKDAVKLLRTRLDPHASRPRRRRRRRSPARHRAIAVAAKRRRPDAAAEAARQAIHDALTGAAPAGITARVTFTNNLFPSGALTRRCRAPRSCPARTGRLWATNDGRGRLELQSNAGDAQIVWNDTTGHGLRRVVEHRLQASRFPATAGHDGDASTPPTLSEITDVPRRSSRSTRRVSGAQPDNVAGPAGLHRLGLAEARRRSARLGAARVGRGAAACRSASRSTRRASSTPALALEATEISYGAGRRRRRRRRAARRREGRRPELGTRRRRTSGANGSTPSRRPGSPAVQAAVGFTVAAPDTLVGLPRQDVRLVGRRKPRSSSTGRDSARSSSSSARPTGAAARAACRGLPTVSLDGATGHELATQLGTVIVWQQGGVDFVLAGSLPPAAAEAAARDAEVSDARPSRHAGSSSATATSSPSTGVDLTVEAGDVFGYLGPNGAGKTTSLRMLLGLIRPTRGVGEALRPRPARRRRDARSTASPASSRGRASIRISPGGENLRLLADYDEPASASRIEEVLELVELRDRAKDRVGGYSHGMRQRLGIAASLLREPQLLLLDEPATGLDPAGMRDMRDLIRRLAGEGITILLSSHLLYEVEELCNRVAIIRKGSIVYEGSLDDLLATASSRYRLRSRDPSAREPSALNQARDRRRRARRRRPSLHRRRGRGRRALACARAGAASR